MSLEIRPQMCKSGGPTVRLIHIQKPEKVLFLLLSCLFQYVFLRLEVVFPCVDQLWSTVSCVAPPATWTLSSPSPPLVCIYGTSTSTGRRWSKQQATKAPATKEEQRDSGARTQLTLWKHQHLLRQALFCCSNNTTLTLSALTFACSNCLSGSPSR